MVKWWSIVLALTAVASCVTAEATTTATTDRANTSLTQRTAEVTVIDVTRNTSTVVAIPIDLATGNATAQQEQLVKDFRCIREMKANLFLLVHLNRNWREKLSFVRNLIFGAYRQGSTNVAIVFFNAFTKILATFGSDPLKNEAELLLGLARVQSAMERDENAAVTEHWVQFKLDDALHTCFDYAQLFLHQFSLDARPSFFLFYFDEVATISQATIVNAEKALRKYKPERIFNASISVLQLPSSMPVPLLWTRVSELLSSSPSYQLTGPSEDYLLGQVAKLATTACNMSAPVV